MLPLLTGLVRVAFRRANRGAHWLRQERTNDGRLQQACLRVPGDDVYLFVDVLACTSRVLGIGGLWLQHAPPVGI